MIGPALYPKGSDPRVLIEIKQTRQKAWINQDSGYPPARRTPNERQPFCTYYRAPKTAHIASHGEPKYRPHHPKHMPNTSNDYLHRKQTSQGPEPIKPGRTCPSLPVVSANARTATNSQAPRTGPPFVKIQSDEPHGPTRQTCAINRKSYGTLQHNSQIEPPKQTQRIRG